MHLWGFQRKFQVAKCDQPFSVTLVLISAVTTVDFACSDFGHLQVRLGTSQRCRRAGGGMEAGALELRGGWVWRAQCLDEWCILHEW